MDRRSKKWLIQCWLTVGTLVTALAVDGGQTQHNGAFAGPAPTASQPVNSVATRAAILDCPLRDKPFSVKMPGLDLLLSPAAKAVVEERHPGALERIPPHMKKTEPPSFGAIVSVEQMLGRAGVSSDDLDALDARLAQIKVTDEDRKARCARYDNDDPGFSLGNEAVQLMVFEKINGFDHGPSVTAATTAIKQIAEELGWGVAVTRKGGAFNPDTLSQFDAVVWNNTSGDVLTLSQRTAFKDYITRGGGFLGIHGAGGDAMYYWDFYVEQLIGARFIGHPSDPQFQDADLRVEPTPSGIAESLAPGWTMKDEWYSFAQSPRSSGADVVITLDESTYIPEGYGQDLRMGEDHPIVWTRCIGAGRSVYSAIGHRPEVYQVAENLTLLKDSLIWAAGKGENVTCAAQDDHELSSRDW